MPGKNRRRRALEYKKRKREQKEKAIQTNKIMDRLSYEPHKHKKKMTRKLRLELQKKQLKVPSNPQIKTEMKFASININLLDLEASVAVETFMKEKSLDVRCLKNNRNSISKYW